MNVKAWSCPDCGDQTELLSVVHIQWIAHSNARNWAATAKCRNGHVSSMHEDDETASLEAFLVELDRQFGIVLPEKSA